MSHFERSLGPANLHLNLFVWQPTAQLQNRVRLPSEAQNIAHLNDISILGTSSIESTWLLGMSNSVPL